VRRKKVKPQEKKWEGGGVLIGVGIEKKDSALEDLERPTELVKSIRRRSPGKGKEAAVKSLGKNRRRRLRESRGL